MRTGDEDLADAAFRHYAAILCPCHDADAGVELIIAFRVTQVGQVMEGSRVVPNLVIGGKSMGGRIASLIADAARVKGLVCLGYPFHAPGREPGPNRLEHLEGLETPTLICQGTRDALGTRDEIAGYRLSTNVQLHWLEDGDHSFKPRKASGLTEDETRQNAINAISGFIKGL